MNMSWSENQLFPVLGINATVVDGLGQSMVKFQADHLIFTLPVKVLLPAGYISSAHINRHKFSVKSSLPDDNILNPALEICNPGRDFSCKGKLRFNT